MSDQRSKAEKLAEGKKKLKKFQAKGKTKGQSKESDAIPNVQKEIENETNFPNQTPVFEEPKGEVLPNASQFFSNVQDCNFPVFETPPVPPQDYASAESASFDQISSLQSKNIENLSKLSDNFSKLELEVQNSGIMSETVSNTDRKEAEERNQELSRKLDEEKDKCHKLEIRLREQYSNVDSLKLELQKLQLENTSKLNSDLKPLRDQLDNHIQTVAVLVGEKAELTAHVSAFESLAKTKEQENEELKAKLTASRHQVQELKQENGVLKKSLDKFDNSQQNLCSQVENSRDELKTLKSKYEDLCEENLELKRKLDLKNQDFITLESNLQEKLHELNFAQLRLTQLATPEDDQMMRERLIEATAQQRIVLEEQIQELLKQVEKANSDRETAANQYQSYVQQLSKERESLIAKVQELTKEKDGLSKRDSDLVKHIGDLEKQIQQQMNIQAKVSSSPQPTDPKPQDTDNKELNDTIVKLENEKEVLQEKLTEEKENVHRMSDILKTREDRIQELESETERLRHSHVDPQQITATLESEKVAASRAMAQNQDLRAQLTEMQRAFVQMTNDKATLMNELESERYLGREMRNRYEEWDVEVKALRQKLHFKDEEMIRLAHESTEHQKQILTLSQELDQLRHLEMNKQNQNHLQYEIQKQREQILRLQLMIKQKEDEVRKMDSSNNDMPDSPTDVSVAEEVDEALLATEVEQPIPVNPEQVEVTQVLLPEEAMLKLQERFTKTMDEIAELTDEKQRLEHLVIQLQGETETIGEYIALYQSQRKLLKQREIEKDIQVQQITADREEMKDKLVKLNSLVELMLKQKNIEATAIPQNQERPIVNGSDAKIFEPRESVQESKPLDSKETAEQILNLLTEIKTNNANTNFLTVSDHHFQTCSCCSGQLLTV